MSEAMTIRNTMICWTPTYCGDAETVGQVALIDWPERVRASDRYAMSTGACESHVAKLNPLQRRQFVLSTALGMIVRDGMAPSVVHAALLPLVEYRDGLPEDAAQ